MLSFIYIGMARLGEVGALSREQPALRSLEQSVLATFAALLSGGGASASLQLSGQPRSNCKGGGSELSG